MEDTLVSARMPAAKKERARGALSQMGATVSDLINSAFDYVIATGQLPTASAESERNEDGLAEFVADTSFDIDWPENPADYKKLMEKKRLSDYESLARH